jgi:hypothetical protein
MKCKIIFLACFLSISSLAHSQIKFACDGKIGIGDITPSYPLHVKGDNIKFESASSSMRFDLTTSYPGIHGSEDIHFHDNTTGWQNIVVLEVTEMSDSALKKDVKSINDGLEVINKLRGVTYSWKNDSTGQRNAGLIAQEVEKVIPGMVHTTKDSNEKSLAYSQVIPYLIEAIKELDRKVEDQKKSIEEFNIDALKKSQIITKDASELNNNAILFQNVPNPFNHETSISYIINYIYSNAAINVYNLNGYQLLSFDLNSKGECKIVINANQLKPGMYLYNLLIDGKVMDTKRMILTD